MDQRVTNSIVDGVATITLDDGRANTLSPEMQAGINAALDEAEAAGAVVVLRGREGRFSAGFDLGVLSAGGQPAVDMVVGGFRLARRLVSFPRPVIVACTGHAIAMGAFLLLATDLRVATTEPAKFATNEVAIGMTMPHTAIALMQFRLAPAARERAMLLAETFTPEGAVAAGFVDELVVPEEFDRHVAEVAARLAALDARAHRSSKLRSRAALLAQLDTAIDTDREELESIFLR